MRCPHDSHSFDQTETGSARLPQATSTGIACWSTAQADTEHVEQTELLNYAVQALSPPEHSPIRRALSDSAVILVRLKEQCRTNSRQQTDQRKAKSAAAKDVLVGLNSAQTESKCDDELDEWRQWADRRKAAALRKPAANGPVLELSNVIHVGDKCDELDEWRQWADRRKAAALMTASNSESRLIDVIEDDLDACFGRKMKSVLAVLGTDTANASASKCPEDARHSHCASRRSDAAPAPRQLSCPSDDWKTVTMAAAAALNKSVHRPGLARGRLSDSSDSEEAPKQLLLRKGALLLGRGLSFIEVGEQPHNLHGMLQRSASFSAASA